MGTITRAEAIKRIYASGEQIFGVCFTKRTTGESRTMAARLGVKNHLRGGKRAYDPTTHGLISVFDMQKSDYRCIPIEGLISVSFDGEHFMIADSADNPA